MRESKRRGKCFTLADGRECVSDHIFGRAVDNHKSNRSFFNDPANKMISDTDLFHSGVILVAFGEGYGRLIV